MLSKEDQNLLKLTSYVGITNEGGTHEELLLCNNLENAIAEAIEFKCTYILDISKQAIVWPESLIRCRSIKRRGPKPLPTEQLLVPIGVSITSEQAQWLAQRMARTNQNKSAVVRQLVQDAMVAEKILG